MTLKQLVKDCIAVAIFFSLALLFLSGCASISPNQIQSAQTICSDFEGFKKYTAKVLLKHDVTCGDGMIISNWKTAK